MPKNKHRKFSEINSYPNVVQPGYRFPVYDHHLKGKWHTHFFYNDHPIVLEVGCGKGEYTISLARAYPHINFIGIDIKGDRLWKGASEAMKEALPNVGFLRIQAEHLYCFFKENEIEGIWITFPDPQPNKPRERKRLTSPRMLQIYKSIIKPGAPIHLKTDSKMLYQYTHDTVIEHNGNIIAHTDDLYGNPGNIDPYSLQIKTYYENIYLSRGEKICFLKFAI